MDNQIANKKELPISQLDSVIEIIKRTSKIVKEYDGHDLTTFILNCTHGIINVPYELYYIKDKTKIPILNDVYTKKDFCEIPLNIRLHILRNAASHCNYLKIESKTSIRGLIFTFFISNNKIKYSSILKINSNELKDFLLDLAKEIINDLENIKK